MQRAQGSIESFASLVHEIALIGRGQRLADPVAVSEILREAEVGALRWPADRTVVNQMRIQRVPRLLVVEAADDPPDPWDALEDWVRLPAMRRDIEVRVNCLRRRATELQPRPAVDGFDRLLYDGRWVSLTPNDYKLIAPLVECFDSVVTYEDLGALLAPVDGPAPVVGRARLTRLRRRIAPLGLEIRRVRPHGLALTARRDPFQTSSGAHARDGSFDL